jgi:hypothetical protein
MESSRLLRELVNTGQVTESAAKQLEDAFSQDSRTTRGYSVTGNVSISTTLPAYNQLLAVSNVFNTVEVVELIFTHLPPADLLLRGQLVCKGFKDIIDHSPGIACALFRKPDYRCAFAEFPVEIKGVPISRNDNKLMISLDKSSGRSLPGHAALQPLYMVQPPLRHFRLWVEVGWYREWEEYLLSDNEGLTFGFLSKEILTLKKECERKNPHFVGFPDVHVALKAV